MTHNYKHAGLRAWRGLVVGSLVVLALFGEIRLAGAAAAKPGPPPGRVAIVTILEGKATVIRNLGQFDVTEGVRLLPGDLLRTQAKSLMRIEYPDECSVEAGPDTQLQLFHPVDKKRANRPALYLMEGWLKLGCKTGTDAALTLRDLDVVGISKVLVIRATGDNRAIFAEQGTARVVKHSGGSISLNQGDFLNVEPDVVSDAQPRPTAQFMEALPRAYRDTLPSRYSVYVSRTVEPQNQRGFGYADVEQWVNAELAVRRQFLSLWLRKVNDPAFRAPLDRDLAKHPEWDRILHPEKYEVEETVPPPPAGANRNAAAQPGPDSRSDSVPRRN
jgi:hypothetical protein